LAVLISGTAGPTVVVLAAASATIDGLALAAVLEADDEGTFIAVPRPFLTPVVAARAEITTTERYSLRHEMS
jgi:hypothetical protein